MVRMLEQVQKYADFYRVMLSAKGDPAFVERILEYSEMRLRGLLPGKEVQMQSNSPPVGLCLSYLAHGGGGEF